MRESERRRQVALATSSSSITKNLPRKRKHNDQNAKPIESDKEDNTNNDKEGIENASPNIHAPQVREKNANMNGATKAASPTGPSRDDFVNDLMARFMKQSGGYAAVSNTYIKRVITDLADRKGNGLVQKCNENSSDTDDSTHEECPICLDVFDNPVLTPCAHVTCYDCMPGARKARNKLGTQLTCPVCRHEFKKGQLTFVTEQDPTKNRSTTEAAAFGSLQVPLLASKWSKAPKVKRDAKTISKAIAEALHQQRQLHQSDAAQDEKEKAVFKVPTIAQMKSGHSPFKTSTKLQVNL